MGYVGFCNILEVVVICVGGIKWVGWLLGYVEELGC